MIILIAGASHTGKTLLAQRLLEKYHYPYLIETHFDDIRSYGSAIEHRLDDSDLSKDILIRENEKNLKLCLEHGCRYIPLDNSYSIALEDIVK